MDDKKLINLIKENELVPFEKRIAIQLFLDGTTEEDFVLRIKNNKEFSYHVSEVSINLIRNYLRDTYKMGVNTMEKMIALKV